MTYIQPLLSIFLLLALIGLARLPRGNGSRLTAAGVLGLLLISWPPVDWLISRPLELWYPVREFRGVPAQAIVVLASAVNPPLMERPYPLALGDTYERCQFAAWLHKQRQPLPLLACGGPGNGEDPPFSVTMKQLLQQGGVPEEMIWTEERSLNTYENAVYGSAILRAHGISHIILVVEAQSMFRAESCFRKQGIHVTPAPSAFRQFGNLSDELMPSWKAISRNESVLHETVGLAWYWLQGRI